MRSVRTSYIGLFGREFPDGTTVARIEIPMLQRDFAQGRADTRTRRIRERFLDALIDAIEGSAVLSLDFVYGDVEENALLPLDGQQRLTTLFLLHWYVAVGAGRHEPSAPWLRLGYATRASARMFCESLARYAPSGWQESPSEWIIDQSWYLQTWEDDPTIQSMLVVLDDLHGRLKSVDVAGAWERLNADSAAPITFHVLPMKEMGLSDDIYIKMNSRGKPLTEFELFKARFERLLETASPELAQVFATKIDGEWAQIFWRRGAPAGEMDDATLHYIRYLSDIFVWRSGKIASPYEDLESLAIRTYGGANEACSANAELLIKGFETWAHEDAKAWFASWFAAHHGANADGGGKVSPLRLFRTADRLNCNLLAACSRSHDTGARNREFGWPEVLLFYAVLLHRWRTSEDFGRRARIVRNLIERSEDELRADRMPDLVADVSRIILDGRLDQISGFNQRIQAEDERAKRVFLEAQPELEPVVFELEDHPLLRGCLVAFDLDAQSLPRRASAFTELFSSDQYLTLLTGAMLAAGEYGAPSRGRFFQLGSSVNLAPWRTVFTSASRESLGPTRVALERVLDHIASRASLSVPDSLNAYIEAFLTQCESEQRLDWRYYFVKYPEMRQGASGRYVGSDVKLGYSVCMLEKLQMNSYYRDPFLHALRLQSGVAQSIADSEFTGYETVPRWMLLKKSEIAIRSVDAGFHVRVPDHIGTGNVSNLLGESGLVETNGVWLLSIPQQSTPSGSIDTTDRIQRGGAFLRALVAAGY